MILSNERTEFKKAIAELKMEIVDKISSAVIERVTDVVHNSAEDVAGAAARESFYIGEIGPGEEEHCNNTGKDFVWNTKADEFSPMFEDSNCFAEYWDMLHFGSATAGESYEVVYSNQKHMKLYSFKRGLLMNSLHEVAHSNQQHMGLYRFVRTALSDSDSDGSEDSYTRNADACMANWHNRDENVPVHTVLSNEECVCEHTELSEEECARIRYNLLNDDCMRLNEEDLALFMNLSARSATWHDDLSIV